MIAFRALRHLAIHAVAAAIVIAAIPVAFAADIRLGPMKQLCILDRANPAHDTAWSMVDVQMKTRDVELIAAVSFCNETNRSGMLGLTAVYAERSEIGLSRDRIADLSGAELDAVPVMFEDPETFMSEAYRRFSDRSAENAKLAGLHVGDMLIEATDLPVSGLFRGISVTGMTPTDGAIVRTLTLDIAEDAEYLEFYAVINARILATVREHNPSIALRRGN
jgi:hypothetical protein